MLTGGAAGCAMAGVSAAGVIATGPAASVEQVEGKSRANWGGVGLLLVASGCAIIKQGVS